MKKLHGSVKLLLKDITRLMVPLTANKFFRIGFGTNSWRVYKERYDLYNQEIEDIYGRLQERANTVYAKLPVLFEQGHITEPMGDYSQHLINTVFSPAIDNRLKYCKTRATVDLIYYHVQWNYLQACHHDLWKISPADEIQNIIGSKDCPGELTSVIQMVTQMDIYSRVFNPRWKRDPANVTGHKYTSFTWNLVADLVDKDSIGYRAKEVMNKLKSVLTKQKAQDTKGLLCYEV